MAALKQGGQWHELIATAERSLTGENGTANSLWWVRGHLGALSMPVSLLIAPFERVARELADEPAGSELRVLLEETAGIMLERLQQVAERSQVDAFQGFLREFKVATVQGVLGKHRSAWTLETEPAGKKGAAPPVAAQPSKVVRRRAPRIAIVLLLLLFFVGCFFAISGIRTSLFSAPTALASEEFVRDPAPPEQEQVTLLPRDPMGDLSALFYSIEPAAPTAAAGGQAQAADPQPPGTTTAADQASGPAASTAPALPKPKERINTDGPVEGEEYRSGVDRSASGAGQVNQAPGARLPGSQQGISPFDRPARGDVYRVLVRANVVGSPSYRAAVIGRLQPGDEVLVDGRVGAWLRLRSRRGNEGFILAQDAEPVVGKTERDLQAYP